MTSTNEREASSLVTIREFGDISDALLAQGCLDSAGIENFLADTNIARLEWPVSRGMRLQVNAEDADAALEMLQQPAGNDSKA